MRHAPSCQTLNRQAQYDQNQHQPDTHQAPPLGPVMVLVQIKTTALIKDSRGVLRDRPTTLALKSISPRTLRLRPPQVGHGKLDAESLPVLGLVAQLGGSTSD